MDLENDDLPPLESLTPEERWQENEMIPIPVPCDPETNNGFHFRLVCHRILRENYSMPNEGNCDYPIQEKQTINEYTSNNCSFVKNCVDVDSSPNLISKTTFRMEDSQINLAKNSDGVDYPESVSRKKTNSNMRDLREFLNERRQCRDDGANEKHSNLQQNVVNPEELLMYQEWEGLNNDQEHTWPDMTFLCSMKHIAFVDLDNWPRFFTKMKHALPAGTFVWGFYGGGMNYKSPKCSLLYETLMAQNCFYLHPKCGRTKDAADFAICTTAGILDAHLPKNIPFTVISGDKGFQELGRQLHLRNRIAFVVDPHVQDIDSIYKILGVGQHFFNSLTSLENFLPTS